MPFVDPPLTLLPDTRLLIGDLRIGESSGGVYSHVYAATAKPTGPVTLAGSEEMALAADWARRSLPVWRSISSSGRRDLILNLCNLIVENEESLANLQTIENSVPLRFSRLFPRSAAEYLAHNAGWTDKIHGEVVSVDAAAFDYTRAEPYGVIAMIIPWNAPLPSLGQLLGPALAAGNTVVVKPSELAPYTSLRIGELALQAGFPPGVINVVPAGPEGASALVRQPSVNKIHFTGSSDTARKVLAGALQNLTPVSLELGGKSALLVFSDADLLAAAQQAVSAAVILSGQGCVNNTRVLVEKSIYKRLLKLTQGLMRRVVVGDPFNQASDMGPVISAAACDRIMGVIARARQESCGHLVAGGERLGGELHDGYFIAPTLFAEVDNNSALAQNEIFGPVVSFTSFETEQEAVQLANGTRFGLAGYLYTNDLQRVHRVCDQLVAGNVWVNGFDALPPGAPFGGVKESGYGRIGGRHGIREFTTPKNVWISVASRSSHEPRAAFPSTSPAPGLAPK